MIAAFGQWRLQDPKFEVILGSMVTCSQHGLSDPSFNNKNEVGVRSIVGSGGRTWKSI